jgi:hypothetical protein
MAMDSVAVSHGIDKRKAVGNLSSPASTPLLALRLARRLTPRALEAALGDVDSNKAARAPPPGRREVAALEPVLVDRVSSLLDVLAVVLPQVVPEVVATVEGLTGAGAPRIVTEVTILESLRRMCVPVVPLEVGTSLEWARAAARREAEDGPVTAGICPVRIYISKSRETASDEEDKPFIFDGR